MLSASSGQDKSSWSFEAMNPKAPAMDLILIPGVAFDEECNRVRFYYST